ncbi:MAG: DUF3618 domain-containing protein [Pseudonocardiaceae bacterium]
MSSSEQERLQDEIEELRGELGETVEALVHKADVPARVKERGSELRDQAVERGIELRDQAVERGTELRDRAAQRGMELRDRAVDGAERARAVVSRTPTDRWAMLAGAGAALITLAVIVRRILAR